MSHEHLDFFFLFNRSTDSEMKVILSLKQCAYSSRRNPALRKIDPTNSSEPKDQQQQNISVMLPTSNSHESLTTSASST